MEVFADVDGHQRCLPIVSVDDVRPEQKSRHGDRGHREDREAHVVVRKIRRPVAVDSIAIVQRRAVDKVIGDVVLGGLVHIRQVTGPQWNPEIAISLARKVRIMILPVGRNDHSDIFTPRVECGRQPTQNIGQTAGFCEGRGFGSHHQDVHLRLTTRS